MIGDLPIKILVNLPLIILVLDSNKMIIIKGLDLINHKHPKIKINFGIVSTINNNKHYKPLEIRTKLSLLLTNGIILHKINLNNHLKMFKQ